VGSSEQPQALTDERLGQGFGWRLLGCIMLCLATAVGLTALADGGILLFAKWLARLSLGCWLVALVLLGSRSVRVRAGNLGPDTGGHWPLLLFLASLPLFAASALLELIYK
jgi:hypothetical protein